MNENKVRILPPLVYGKLSGILDLVFDKIELLGQPINKNAICSLAVHVLWWGETKPLFIRPKIIQILTEDEQKKIFINEYGGNSMKYEIRTKLNLFRSYLANCDLMELPIFDTSNNEVIGSAFLKDLINLIFSSQLLSNSIINHMGNVIGEITYHFTFCEIMSKSSVEIIQQNLGTDLDKLFSNNISTNKLTLNLSELDSHRGDTFIESKYDDKYPSDNTVLTKSDEVHYLQNDNEFQRNTNLHYNSPVIQNFDSQLFESEAVKIQEHFQNMNLLESDSSVNPDMKQKNHQSSKISVATYNDKQINVERDCVNNTNIKKVLIGTPKIISVIKKKTKAVESNKVTKLNASSKELKQRESLAKAKEMDSKDSKHSVKLSIKKITYNKNKNSTEKKVAERKITDSNSTVVPEKKSKISNASDAANHMNIKSRPKLGRNSKCNLKAIIKPTEKLKTIENVSNEISKINKICFDSPKSCKNKHSDLEKLSVSDNELDLRKNKILPHSIDGINKKIDVHIDVVKMMPNIEHIKQNKSNKSQLYENEKSQFREKTASDYEESSSARLDARKRINVNQNLCFDLNDPIERLYYETFFSNAKFQNSEFEIAEMLNRTSDKYVLMQIPCNRSYNSAFNRNEHITGDHLKSELKGKKDYVLKKSTKQSFQATNDKIFENCSDSFEEESDNLSRISEEKLSSILKNESNGKKTNCNDENEVLKFNSYQTENIKKTEVFPYCFDCHRFVYSKKLRELDKIIGALKNFETDLKKDAKISIQSFECNSVKDNESSPAEYFKNGKENHASGGKEKCPNQEVVLKTNSIESDYSKEDSEFMELTHYMSKR